MVGQPARTYLQKHCTDIGCSIEDMLRVMDDNGERGSGKSMLVAGHDYDDIFIYICILHIQSSSPTYSSQRSIHLAYY